MKKINYENLSSATLKHICVVDDDPQICHLLQEFLSEKGFLVTAVSSGEAMYHQLKQHTFDLIILDLMLPGEDGLSLCRKLRASDQTPIIMLTAMGDDADRICGLEMGADDYVTKPPNPRELLARIRAVLRRSAGGSVPIDSNSDTQTYRFDGWVLDCQRRMLLDDAQCEITLTSGEYNLLAVFVTHANCVLDRDRLLTLTRGRTASAFDRSVDIQISRLRHKIEKDPKSPKLIKTIRSGGYIFSANVQADTQ